MNTKTKTITIRRVDDYIYNFESEIYSENNITECQLMSILGAVLGVTITDPLKPNSRYFRIDVTMISPE